MSDGDRKYTTLTGTSTGATVVTQARLRSDCVAEYGKVQQMLAECARGFDGFVEQTVIPPNPPMQLDWMTMSWFATPEQAGTWLRSPERHELLEQAQPLTTGQVHTYLVRDGQAAAAGSVASAVIATHVRDNRDADFREWQRRVVRMSSHAPGFRGYRLEQPIPGVQDSWLTVLWFDTDADLQLWLASPGRAELLRESEEFVEDLTARAVRTGFDQWFDDGPSGVAPPAWKANMMVLTCLYPGVFILDTFFVPPFERAGVPFWLAMFIANALTVTFLSIVVPLARRPFGWWLESTSRPLSRRDWAGIGAVCGVYAVCLVAAAIYTTLRK